MSLTFQSKKVKLIFEIIYICSKNENEFNFLVRKYIIYIKNLYIRAEKLF